MYAAQYSPTSQISPPPYAQTAPINEQFQHDSTNFCRSSEERMIDFQQLVNRYESR
jgi:hypothetical protein